MSSAVGTVWEATAHYKLPTAIAKNTPSLAACHSFKKRSLFEVQIYQRDRFSLLLSTNAIAESASQSIQGEGVAF